MLFKIDGYIVCSELRKKFSVFIIMLIVCGDIFDCVMGLEFGVDDYVIKFFLLKELEVCICFILCWIEKIND